MTGKAKTKGNDDGSAGGLAGFVILFIVASIFIAFLAPIVDRTNDANNDMIGSPGLPVSQDRITTLQHLTAAFSIMGIMILLGLGINLWINSIRDQSSEV